MLALRIVENTASAMLTGSPMLTAFSFACSTTSFRDGTLTDARVDLKRVASRMYAALRDRRMSQLPIRTRELVP